MKLFKREEKAPDGADLNKVGLFAAAMGKIADPGKFTNLPDPLSAFYFPNTAATVYRKMRKQDPIVGSLMLNLENILISKPYVLEKGDSSARDFAIISELFSHYLSPRVDLLSQIVSALTYGFVVSEKIFDKVSGYIVPIDFSPRHQTTIHEINYTQQNIKQMAMGLVDLPYAKCLHHVYYSEARDPYGVSLLRHVYKPYYYKCDIEASEASGLERDLAGLPVMEAPQGFDFESADENSNKYDASVALTLQWAVDTISNIRKDTQQGVVLPFGWKLTVVKGENRTVIPTSDIIVRYNNEIAYGLLQNFLSFTATNLNAGVADIQILMFYNAISHYLRRNTATLNNIIAQIGEYNNITKLPYIKTPKPSTSDLKVIGEYFSGLKTAGLINGSDELTDLLLKLPELDMELKHA